MAAVKLCSLVFESQKVPYFGAPQHHYFSNHGSPKPFLASTSNTKELQSFKRYVSSVSGQQEVILPLPPQKIEIMKAMESWVGENVLIHLKPVEMCWQPQDLLPDPTREGFLEQVRELRERAEEIPDEYFVVLVGEMVTEEALPTYQTRYNCIEEIRDETGVSSSAWAVWSRGWTAEENRHGDLLNKYLYLSGRVDMKQVGRTIQYLIGSGMDIQTENDPYKAFIYASFQERATFISHVNTAKLAKQHGDTKLAQICGLIASDEKRHETAYTKMVKKLFEMDPDETVVAFADMMRKRISMPAHLMHDGCDPSLFDHFSAVAVRLGVYTVMDYIDIVQHLVYVWNVEKLRGLSDRGRKAQDYLCGLAPKLRNLEERNRARANDTSSTTIPFTWIFNRQVKL